MRSAPLVLAVLFLVACQEKVRPVGSEVPPPPGASEARASPACADAWVESHGRESTRMPAAEAWGPSLLQCADLAEWTAAAKQTGHRMAGREARFVDSVCRQSAGEVRALRICKEAAALVPD